MTAKKAMTIAGSDSGGGAGIQADLKTFQELGVFGTSAITAVTAQNTLGVHGVYPMSADAVEKQIDAVIQDIGLDALKTGMLFSTEIIEAVASKIKEHNITNVIVDPVMIAKGGAPLLQEEAMGALKTSLLPLALVVTPNIPEAEAISGVTIKSVEDKEKAAKVIASFGVKNVLIKGGHDEGNKTIDLLYDGESFYTFTGQRIDTKDTHGTGCTFSAAMTAAIAKGGSVRVAAETAKQFIQAAIEDGINIGNGHGPTNHWAYKKRGKC
ncbi:bifunctional hydroxymethylpyrimidine kinase/phosphomethylpyrimidine kinase [Domibacillus epiphyticus]|uniref:Hydroxymethylpyrimidine/phosphomethylpyrimidine kinase n=1 Tax=Domibacillus epiphyticus TaxID=1714355 RepID=A0A1V2A5D7_9BACI|nr:bifunctional hydroxymethylpyrimidine kinase/phosphomethylpyrimidine kinase [Domibacillus epiphyticus]OMP66186.1 bifunctional hydroxymethylpyrimidine kinase/phosphomethylpyrimidine kinase [Domibacillus epiphyticus]